jgi:hypothetical protein
LTLADSDNTEYFLRCWLGFLLKSQIMFPTITLIILAFIWTSTLQLIALERTNALRAASLLSDNLADIYETQVQRDKPHLTNYISRR